MMSMEKAPVEWHGHSWPAQTKDLILLSLSNIRITPDAPGLACVWPSVPTPCRRALRFWLSHCTELVSCIRLVMGDLLKSVPGSCLANRAHLWADKDKQKVDLLHAVSLFTVEMCCFVQCSVERHGRLNACCDVGSSVAMVTASPAKHCGELHREMCMEYHERWC